MDLDFTQMYLIFFYIRFDFFLLLLKHIFRLDIKVKLDIKYYKKYH